MGAFGILGRAGAAIAGRGGGAMAGREGIDGAANAGGAAFPGACFPAPAASPAGFMALTEMTCVYALGPLGGGGGPGGGSITGRANARVAPSDGSEDDAATGNFTIGGGVIGGVGKIVGAVGTYDIGGGGGAGDSLRGSGTTGAGSTTARGSPMGGGAVVLDIRDGISGVNHPVNPVPAGSFPAIPAAGGASSGCGFNGPNIAVKSPTFFRGVSIGGEDTAGVGDGLSPRNGP